MPDRRLLPLLELIRHQSDRLLLLLDQMDLGAFLADEDAPPPMSYPA